MFALLSKVRYWKRKQFLIQSDEARDSLIGEVRPSQRSVLSIYFRLFRRVTFRFYQWIALHPLLCLMLFVFILPSVFYCLMLLVSKCSVLIPKQIQNQPSRLLLVVAHPDDECLFFAPTLINAQAKLNFNVSVLVFSRGNHKGLGQLRANELMGSCAQLKIPIERCVSLDLPNLQDHPKVWWNEEIVIPIIGEYIDKWSIDFLVTFDELGISGHINHRSLSSAIQTIIRSQQFPTIKVAYKLETVQLLRKYSGLMDFYFILISYIPRFTRAFLCSILPFSWIDPVDASRILFISTPADYFQSRLAFQSHRTQFSWDRDIYLIISRYMFVNELRKIVP